MRKMEILLGRIFRDCCLCGTGDADFGICSFAIESGKWIRIGNRMKNTTLHVSAPEMKKKASQTILTGGLEYTCRTVHISPGESVVMPLEQQESTAWKKVYTLYYGECIVQAAAKEIMLQEKNRYETDFVSFILEHEGLEVAGDRYGISHVGNFSVSTEDGQKNTVYMGRCPVEDGKVSVPWEKFFIKKDGGKNITFTAFRQTAGKSAERGKENDMGIISALLSGGILIGKICQGISGALSSMVSDEKKGLAASTDNLEFDNLKFMMLKGSSDTQPKLYALNCSSDLKMVQFPADKNGNCLCYAVQGGEKVQIEDSVTAANPTDVVEISTSEDNSASDGFTAMKVLLNGLTIGSSAEVNVYGYRFAAEEDGIRILGGKASSLDYIALTSESGIRVTSTDSITPASVSDDLFPFSFKDCGLKTGDVLSGELHFTSASNALLLKNAIASESLTEEEKEFLTGIGVLK